MSSQQADNRGKDSSYRPVSIQTIAENAQLAFDLYLFSESRGYILFAARNSPVTPSSLARILEKGRRVLYVSAGSEADYYRYLRTRLDTLFDESSRMSQEELAAALYKVASQLVVDILADPTDPQPMHQAIDVARGTATFVMQSRTIQTILGVNATDHATHTHCVNVCTYGVALARQMGWHEPKKLEEFGTGLLLHDVGVSRLDEPVPDPVSEAETPRHLEHIDKAEEILQLHDFIPETALQVVRQHHERYDGSGYPEGLSRSDIHPLARIAGLIDVFDLLTTGDDSRQALTSYDALHTIKTQFHRFDPQVFGNLIQMLACSSRLAG